MASDDSDEVKHIPKAADAFLQEMAAKMHLQSDGGLSLLRVAYKQGVIDGMGQFLRSVHEAMETLNAILDA